jgi:hypothetical protein
MLVKKAKLHNEFIIIGEKMVEGYADCYKALPISDDGLKLISALTLGEQTMAIPKSDLQLKNDDLPGIEIQELNIPKEYLDMEIIEDIQRLNS